MRREYKEAMRFDEDACYSALASKDPRFDGRFFTGVRTTGIYCRPVCPARTPKRKNCTFFPCAAAAEEAGFRPCQRCRPETSPGTPAWQGTSATVSRALRLIGEGALDREGVEALALRLGIGGRHLRRLFREHLGTSPLAVAMTRRVHLAKRLLDETDLSITDIAFSAGFGSLRRFNESIVKIYGVPPRLLRRRAVDRTCVAEPGTLSLKLAYRPPFSWSSIINFLRPRAVSTVEVVDEDRYCRTFNLEGMKDVLEVTPAAEGPYLVLKVSVVACRRLQTLVGRVRRLFDLDADPEAVARHLGRDLLLEKLIQANPGFRVPGAFDRFELAIRAIMGQQVSVQGATTLTGRLIQAFGEPLGGNGDARNGAKVPRLLFPKPALLAEADLSGIGIPSKRAEAIRRSASAVRDGDPVLEASMGLEEVVSRLTRLYGIGPWTAQYIAMRALNEPDAFPEGDLGLRRACGAGGKPLATGPLASRAEAWRPWRAYAAMLLWQGGIPFPSSSHASV
jgi:AraC family transcriptional regulator of adaptative response / DNA-3-methyladenine glycosylase II